MPMVSNAGLAGRVALVTGGSRGIGRAIVETLAGAGMTVAFTYRENSAAAEEVIAVTLPSKVFAEAVDVRDSSACAAFAEKVVERAERIDLLVNNAGVIRDNTLGLLEDDHLRAVLDTNVTGAFNMARAVAPYMISERRGKIINISSVSGDKGGRGQTNYAASKGALNAFTRSLAVELAPEVRVHCLAPGWIRTSWGEAASQPWQDRVQRDQAESEQERADLF